METAGHRLRRERKQLDLSLKEFAEPLTKSGNYISRIESGDRTLTRDLASEIEQHYGISAEWLLRENGSKRRELIKGANTPKKGANRDEGPLPTSELLRVLQSAPPHIKEAMALIAGGRLEDIAPEALARATPAAQAVIAQLKRDEAERGTQAELDRMKREMEIMKEEIERLKKRDKRK